MRSLSDKPVREQHNPLQIFLHLSKLQPPHLAGHLIPRPRLLKRLEDAALIPLVLIQSPPGYGKTSLLMQYYQHLLAAGSYVAWLTIDPSDRDLATFVAYLKAVLELGDQDGPPNGHLSRGGETKLSVALSSLLSIVSGKPDSPPLYLFLDEVHHLAGSDSVRVLSMLIEHAPPNLHFVLGFRGEPCLSVARQRMHGQVSDFGVRDLCFQEAEVVSLLEKHGVDAIDESRIQALHQRLEGWVGGLTLAAMLLKRDPEQIQDLANFSGERRQFSDFFLQDVLAQQPEHLSQFLLQTSVLDRLTAPLCNVLTEQQNCQDLLRECESRGLFLMPMDDDRTWYRYHPLFAEFLRRELRQKNEGQLMHLHAQASDWFCQSGDHMEAFNQAMAGKDMLRAAEIMDTYCEDIFGTHENAWLLAEKLPGEIINRFPNILLALVWQLELLWQFETCKKLMGIARQRIQQLEHDQLLPELRLKNLRHILEHRELMLNMLGDDMPQVQTQAQRLIETYDDAHPLVRASLYTALMYARREHYKLEEVERFNTQASEYLQRLPNDLGQVFHNAILGPSRLMAGRTHAAIQALTTALRSAERLAGRRSPLAAMVAVHLAKAHYERDELSQARALLDEHLSQAGYIGFVDQAIAGWLTRARLAMLDGDKAGALRMLDEADVFATEHEFERLRLYTLAERLKWLLRQGETDEVIRLGRKHGLRCEASDVSPHTRITTRDEARALAWVRVAQAEDRLPDAINLARLWHRHLEKAEAVRSMVRWGIIIAHLSVLAADQRAAMRMLRKTMSYAAPCGFIRVFLDEGAWLQGLLIDQLQDTALEGEQNDTFAADLLNRLQAGRSGASANSVSHPQPEGSPVCGALNSRELDILEMVAVGLLNREIGMKLGMTEGSVKWYLQQIYDKIGVRRRSQAAERARQLGILS
ncbi:LuxR family transcriptional regulator, maltose regulon positive regulatory protein [Pseudomonas sp. NFACC23-1]|uniref:LuxR C-terminal-related transcriptional regulator n=1 Tax=unclassified Pseudomonas TaxID=196821 RepID=UPI00087F454C|nr:MULTISPECIES: LuxR C-terminal-related transcriptional regulator [unclassified Pseudomonas]SDB50831.1 LuxR family transcriptional regulator, maltose regulon positive regulatory protein [Pseudomonas sp. NFACC17-2]SEI92773.1 LuxR family transcriptional regulator, maltose regulon positive regulatory protein [Pseudomonas sp. NFACC23-1]SFW85143.1 LuxR family transcriptional regulator, maltose regulon positive regulatory protein [Pseudomonas sp. NFACC16-2]